ncbi:unnamed protein product [Phytophthora lilii]|uniref:HECT-type E3 ubiquitin transferase n=1 Tax=Phytophthora lilii TaxID=2077276 RepID=A0A9W6WN36_9STRA|nr:unnamed protein product [Phytophthora lilii]
MQVDMTITVACAPIVVDDEQQKEKEPKALLSAIFRRKSKVRLTSSTSLLTSSRHSTRRQVRAQRRKEWTRKLDVEGRAYWFRDNTFGGDSTTFPGFVVKFEAANGIHGVVDETEPQREVPEHCTTRESTVATSEANGGVKAPAHATSFQADSNTDEPDPELEHDAENEEYSNGTTTPPRPPVGSIEERLETLTRDTSTKHPKFNSASDVDMDAFKLPLDVQNGSSPAVGEVIPSASLAESMTLATKDFPSKYAHFVMRASALLVPAEREHLRLSIERARVYKDSMESLAIIPVRNTHSVMRINFLDESGVDAGGLHREWFVMLNEALVDPANGLLVCANKNEHTYFLTRCSNADLLPRQLVYLFALGRLVGRALLEGSMLCFHLAPPLLKLMLGYPLSLTDLVDLDPEVYTNLRWLLENDNVDALGLDFTVTIKDGGKYKDVELVPNGKDVTVTDANKREYVERKWQYLLVESVAPQLQVFLQGLYEIIPRDLLLLFDPEEFDFLLCGSDEIDVDDWERNTNTVVVCCSSRRVRPVFRWEASAH